MRGASACGAVSELPAHFRLLPSPQFVAPELLDIELAVIPFVVPVVPA